MAEGFRSLLFARRGLPEVYAYWKSIYLKGLDDALIDGLVKRWKNAPTNQCMLVLWHLGGAVARHNTEDTAFGKRSAPYLLSYDSCWTDRAQTDPVVQWTRDQIEAAKPHSPGGSYLNFPGSVPIPMPFARPTVPTMTGWPRSRPSMIPQTCFG
jgi:hypothetical protein